MLIILYWLDWSLCVPFCIPGKESSQEWRACYFALRVGFWFSLGYGSCSVIIKLANVGYLETLVDGFRVLAELVTQGVNFIIGVGFAVRVYSGKSSLFITVRCLLLPAFFWYLLSAGFCWVETELLLMLLLFSLSSWTVLLCDYLRNSAVFIV